MDKLYLAVLYDKEGKMVGFEVKRELEGLVGRYPNSKSPSGWDVRFWECTPIIYKTSGGPNNREIEGREAL